MDIGGVIDQVTQALTGLIGSGPMAYLVVFGVAALDVVFPIIPSEAVVLLAAVLAGTGQLNVVLVTLAAAVGAFIGDNVAHGIGRTMGRPLMERILKGRMDRLGWIENQINEHGPTLIITGRFLPGGRSLVAIGTGAIRMSWLVFAAFDAIAVTIWALQIVVPGYIGGAAFRERPWIGAVVGAIVSLSVIASIEGARWLFRRRRHEVLPPDMEDRVSVFLDDHAGGPVTAEEGAAESEQTHS
jgi:membrane protein DedA with SNARE-associated domain